jgi:GNAT superfamily N-acetyltransferase
MPITLRHCRGPIDFPLISDFLFTLYQPDNRDGNWFQPIWEYAYTHGMFDDSAVGRIGIWEDAGQVVAVATYELYLGEAFFNVHPAYARLKPQMLEYAQEHLSAIGQDGQRRLKVFINDFDRDFEQVALARGYRKADKSHRPMSVFRIPSPFPEIHVPEAFRLKSLADDNDLPKVVRVLHRGFNHSGEPPPNAIAGIRKMHTGPNFRKDLVIVVESPSGEFVSLAGIWYEAQHRFGYVEPVATDPDYRRRGLARAAVMEAIRRCGRLGATVAYVATDMPFYLSLGFRKLFTKNCWARDEKTGT